MKVLFLYNKVDLYAKIPGGVQICSQQFLDIVSCLTNEVHLFEVAHSRAFTFRLLHRLNLDAYQSYQPENYRSDLLDFIREKEITHVFINKSELLKFSKLIKMSGLSAVPKVIIMSHGNESGDLLGDLTGKIQKFSPFKKMLGILRLGMAMYLESWYRKRYVDLVCSMSDEESALEKWLGINYPFFIPRLIDHGSSAERLAMPNIYGYVGTLNHMPNLAALYQLCDKLADNEVKIQLNVVGGPAPIGKELAAKYSFINYLGALTDEQLSAEVKRWSYFINPIFNYSRGASMKLGKAIEWEIPVITTKAGRRGYSFNEGSLIETEDNAVAMAEQINRLREILPADYEKLQLAIKKVKQSSPTAAAIAGLLQQRLSQL
ncbi:MAG: glycosyltransferase [Pedobacter sp.]|nr:glycosyltransferase [Pedobacter sp.]MDQ8053944.1 glycosyltransferase [Pedobacter sp.]